MSDAELNGQKGFQIQWFRVDCDSCGWSWFESVEYKTARFFYCPKCLRKIQNPNNKRKKERIANEEDIASLKRYFDRISLDHRS